MGSTVFAPRQLGFCTMRICVELDQQEHPKGQGFCRSGVDVDEHQRASVARLQFVLGRCVWQDVCFRKARHPFRDRWGAQVPFGNMQARERLFGQLLDSAMELNHLLKDHTLTLTDLADRFNFASLSHFSRYV